jgi:DNA-binding response OmpR family regulator
MNDMYLKSKKILIVEDETDLKDMLISILMEENFLNIVTADCVKSALEICQKENPEIAILDVILPDGNGFELMDMIRNFTDIPVIFLTAKDDIQDKYSGFGLGADDYITKPFLPKEFIFRLNAVLRRCYKEENQFIELYACKIDLDNAQVIKADETLQLTAKEHDILETLARNTNRIVTIDAICEAVWGENPFGYGNSLLTHIRRIREKIEENPSKPQSLITVKGLGYKLIVESRY